jgi:beta-galactosidase GanA
MLVLRSMLVSAFAAIAAGAALAQVKPLKTEEFSGYWTGTGEVTMNNGATEQLRCVATYRNQPQQIRQNLRCASQGYSITATADLTLAGEAVTGTWEEKTYAANGAITGRVVDGGLNLSIAGPTFSAVMALAHTTCKQAIDITPTGVDVSKITIGLGKC